MAKVTEGAALKGQQKRLSKNSRYAHLDIDGDGIVSDEEMMSEQRMLELEDMRTDMENEDKKQDAQRNMTWFALAGLLLYPVMIILCNVSGQSVAADNLTTIAPTYCIAVVGIVAAFFGAQAYKGKAAVKAKKKEEW